LTQEALDELKEPAEEMKFVVPASQQHRKAGWEPHRIDRILGIAPDCLPCQPEIPSLCYMMDIGIGSQDTAPANAGGGTCGDLVTIHPSILPYAA
jgi:hypothetical protein